MYGYKTNTLANVTDFLVTFVAFCFPSKLLLESQWQIMGWNIPMIIGLWGAFFFVALRKGK